VSWIKEAVHCGASLILACEEAFISRRTYRRWLPVSGDMCADKRPLSKRPKPHNKLSDEEVAAVLTVCNQADYASLPPSQIVPRLADEGIYLASESTFYRVLKAHKQLHHRGRAKKAQKRKTPTTHIATAPRQLWSWDITYLASPVRGRFYYLYLFEDIFSRKIVGWEVYEQESGELASGLLQRTVLQEQCFKNALPVVLHSDNGAPMKSQTFKAKMEEMGIISSYSRPRVSNDNPFSEALFRTLKYCPMWPSNGFNSLHDARLWVTQFTHWYNNIHRHSAIGFVTPAQKHGGEDAAIMANRKTVYERAKQNNPARWARNTRQWEPILTVTLNPEKKEIIEQLIAA
jgi:putative transposase